MPSVQCISNKRSSVSDPACAMFAPRIADELKVGAIYVVYGQSVYRGCLLLLLDTSSEKDTARPFWYSESLFSVVDNTIPSEWVYMHYPNRDFAGPLTAIWGYKDLVTSSEHYLGIMERDRHALKIFAQYKERLNR